MFEPIVWSLAAGTEPVSGFVLALLAILLASGLVALLTQRLGLQMVPVYLITGVLIGPGALSLVGSPDEVSQISELAIVLLMFGIGMHLELTSMRAGLERTLIAATISVVVSVILLTPLAMLTGLSLKAAFAVAMALSLSSTAVVLRLMQQRRELTSMSGRVSLIILVVQDILVIPMLIAIPLLAALGGAAETSDGSAEDGGSALLASGKAALGVLAIVIVGRVLLPRLLAMAARSKHAATETVMILSLGFAIGAAVATQVVGLSSALGAFLAGFLLNATPFRLTISGQVGTIRDVFLAVFFTAVGMRLVPSELLGDLPAILGLSVAAIVLKAAVIALSCWAMGTSGRLAVYVGLALASAGEFGLVLLGVAASTPVPLIDASTLSRWTAVTVVSMLAIPFLMQLGRHMGERSPALARVAPWVRTSTLLEPTERPTSGCEDVKEGQSGKAETRHVVVAGFGVVGRAVCEQLATTDVSVTVIEMNPGTVKTQTKLGRSFIYGDVSDAEVMTAAGVLKASAFVLTIPDEQAVLRACRTARALNPDVFIVARTNYMSRGLAASSEGANEAIVEELVTAEAMRQTVEKYLVGHPDA